jgi:hypothetical protein
LKGQEEVWEEQENEQEEGQDEEHLKDQEKG